MTTPSLAGTPVLRLGPLCIDLVQARATKRGVRIALSPAEYRLILLFAANQGRIVTREMMREALWDHPDAFIEANTLNVYMRRLREKIEDDPSHPAIIKTVRGVGYQGIAAAA